MPEMTHAVMPSDADFDVALNWMIAKGLTESTYTLEDLSTPQFIVTK